MAAAKISIADSGIDLDEVNKKRFGVLLTDSPPQSM